MKRILLIITLAFAAASIASAQDALAEFNWHLTHYGTYYPNQSTDYSQCNRTSYPTEIRPDGMGDFYFYGSSGQRTGAAYTDGMGGYHINYFRGCDY